MSVRQASIPVSSIALALCLVVLMALLPAATLAAPGGKAREYIVTVQVVDSGRLIRPTSKSDKARIRLRAAAARAETSRLTREHGLKARHRFGYATTGFSAVMTPAQARKLARDPAVATVRPARTFTVAAEQIPAGIKRVLAWTSGTTPGPDVDASVAVIDTGIGPATDNGTPIDMVEVDGKPVELNIAGGVNCWDDPSTGTNEVQTQPGRWGDTIGHGTHVAGIIGARDNSVGTIGVAPGVRLYSVRVFGWAGGTEGSVVCGLDWVIARNSDGNAANDIDVVNMSIEGPRQDLRENCATVLADPWGDPIQQAICTLTSPGMGVTIVAAAGNDGINANLSSPGGYDRVISVGAMTDTDGKGWGRGGNASCQGYLSQRDDTYASFSNHGPEVDIVAPGTCVLSTYYLDPSGDALVAYSGTSMATPHVTGAVARYVGARGRPASTAAMRNLVRAAGRLDWNAKSDPVWYGPADEDVPNRVLDVKALTGGDLLRTWVSTSAFRVGGTSKSRLARVDVQRGGGYAGTATLSTSGLPATVGSATFGQKTLSGMGPRDTGTNLRFSLRLDGQDGLYPVEVKAGGPGVSQTKRTVAVTLDRTGPKVSGLAPRLRGNVILPADGKARAILEWQVSDQLSGVRSAQLQRRINNGVWRDAGVGGMRSAKVSLKPGQQNQFRVKASDGLGNTRASAAVWARLSIRDSKSSLWQVSAGSGWRTKRIDSAFGGSLLVASGPTGSLRTGFDGRAVAIAAAVGPNRGKLRVQIDGGQWQVIDLKAAPAEQRKVVWARKLAAGSHTIEVQGLSGQSTLDALLTVR